MKTYEKIKLYFEHREQTIPSKHYAKHFVLQEVGELSDALVRSNDTDFKRNNERYPSVAFEIGDLYQQLIILAEVCEIVCYAPNLKEKKYKTTFFDVSHGAYTFVNNVDMAIDAQYDARHVLECLHAFSVNYNGKTPYENMVAKWKSKGYKLTK